jgi:hypothetical protein
VISWNMQLGSAERLNEELTDGCQPQLTTPFGARFTPEQNKPTVGLLTMSWVRGKPTYNHRHLLEVFLAKTVWIEAILEGIDFCRITFEEVHPECQMELKNLKIDAEFVSIRILLQGSAKEVAEVFVHVVDRVSYHREVTIQAGRPLFIEQ